jgi:hypothetical protein
MLVFVISIPYVSTEEPSAREAILGMLWRGVVGRCWLGSKRSEVEAWPLMTTCGGDLSLIHYEDA